MNNDTTVLDSSRAPTSDALTELLREGARELIYKAVQSELEVFLEKYSSQELPDGRKSVVRNGFLPSRKVQTGIGDVEIRVPKVRDRSKSGIKFNSALLPPYFLNSRLFRH